MANILVVDDDPEILNLVQYSLEAVGHKVNVCENGKDVVNALKNHKPNLLILDVMLPGIDGYSLANTITEDSDLKEMPIIVLTALEPSRSMFQRFPQVTSFITKPFNTEDLVEAVKTSLEKNN